MIGTNIYKINIKIFLIFLFINLKQISLRFIINLSTKKYTSCFLSLKIRDKISCFLSLNIRDNNILISTNIEKALIINFLTVSLSECP